MGSTTRGRYAMAAPVALRAGLLLVVLLAHLAFMASPVHDALLEGVQATQRITRTAATAPAELAQVHVEPLPTRVLGPPSRGDLQAVLQVFRE